MTEKKVRRCKPPYCCIRCGYSTSQKPDIKKHFFSLKKICPALENDIELTDYIKNYILDNRIYKIPKAVKEKTIQQITNNNYQYINTMNNMINTIDVEEKFAKFKKYQNIDVIGIEYDINEKYMKEIKRLENDKYQYGFHLDQNALLEIVDNISKVSDNFEDFNVLYDANMNKVKLYSKNWSPLLVEAGVRKLIETIQDSYLYAYEMYLIKNIYSGKITNYPEVNKYKISLFEYYKFMNIFDIQPYCVNKTNNEILDNEDEGFDIQDKVFKIYNDMKISKCEINKLKKTVIDILKNNSKSIIKDLNKKIIDLLKMNEEFKVDLLKNFEVIKEIDTKEESI